MPPDATDPAYARWPRRIVALVIDWVVCVLVTDVILGHGYATSGERQWLPLVLFCFESALGVSLLGGSFGQLLARIRVRRLNGAPLSPLRALGRSVLVCLVVPPLIFRSESGRGLHDLATDSAAYRFDPPAGPGGRPA